jgi:RND family efflux transporter MFP subunit
MPALTHISRRPGFGRTLGTTFAAALLPALLLGACGEGNAHKTEAAAARPVLVEPVRYAPLAAAHTLVATIKPRVEADLGFRVAGKVAKRMVDTGAAVKAGDVLALLDETDFKLQLEQADAEVRAAQGSITSAAAELERRTFLNKRGYSTQASLDQQRTAVDEARGRLTKGERAIQLSQNALSYTKLLADADGVVTAALVEPGQVVAAGQTAIRVAHTGEREALAAVPEALVDRVRAGTASVTLWAAPGTVYRAKLRELSPAADAATRTYAARFSLPDAGAEAVLGMTATVTVAAPGVASAARLPLSALFNQGNGPALWVVDPASGVLTLKPVEVAKYDGASVYVTGGVSEGESVVALGVQKLDAGQKVRVVTALGS